MFHNIFKQNKKLVAGPAVDLVPITPNDITPLLEVPVSLFIETGGTLVFTSEAGVDRTVVVPDSYTLSCGVRQVKTATTATGIHGYIVR